MGLAAAVSEWQPRSQYSECELDASLAGDVASILDGIVEPPSTRDALPPLWHWFGFREWGRRRTLGADGHPADGPLLPPIPDRSRMFAGGRVHLLAPLEYGLLTHRRSAVERVDVKQGRSGELCFVTVRSEFRQRDNVVRVEELDYVYRSGRSTSAITQRTELEPSERPGWSAPFIPDTLLLFRFSALTANSHRIHYDQSYARHDEGYPDVVVHGPLLAVVMEGLAAQHEPDRIVRHIEFRFRQPVFAGRHLVIEGSRAVDGQSTSVVVRADGNAVAASTLVRFE